MITKQQAGTVVNKFKMVPRMRKELFYQFFWKEKLVLTTAVPKGRGQLNCSDKFRNQLKLNDQQLSLAIRCPFKLRHYIAHLKEIGAIAKDEDDEKS